MSHRIVFIGLWALALIACGSTTQPPPTSTEASCGPASCGGCCMASGRCERGLEVSACGVQGQACVDCSSQGACGLDGRCKVSTPDAGTPDAGVPLGCGAIALPLVNGKAEVSGTTVGAEQQAAGSCGGIDGHEVVYAFTVPSTAASSTDVVVTLTPRDAAFQPVVYLRQGRCDSPQSEPSKACVAAHQPGATVQLQTTRGYDSNTFYLVVDGQTETGGAFDLSVEVGGRSADSCADVLPLTGQRFTVRGTFSGADDAYRPSCDRAGGLDRVYRLETSELAYLHTSIDYDSSIFSAAVAVSDVCGGTERACFGSKGSSSQLPPGTHYVWVDADTSTGYLFRGELVAPPPGDACAQAKPLVFSNGAQGGTATDTVDPTPLHDDWHQTCGGDDVMDVVYSFTTDRTLKLHASATTPAGYTRPLTLVGATCTPDAQVACGTAALDIAALPAGSYFLWVDGLYASLGPATLTVTLE
ncbi:hypothetical protein [Archangium sp.]|uniref:hypothetical protein n=1 Tax=Archangium sp. TaxID=1872627 RepID=UPI00389B01B8